MVQYCRWWPLPYSGLPALLSMTGVILLIASLSVSLFTPNMLSLPLFFIGIVLLLASTGREVVVGDGVVKLYYGFPLKVLRIDVSGIVEVASISDLSSGKIINYFKIIAIPWTIVAFTPTIWLIILILYKTTISTTTLLVLAFSTIALTYIGLLVLIHLITTHRDLHRILRIASIYLAAILTIVNFSIAIIYNQTRHSLLTANKPLVAFIIAGELALSIAYYLLLRIVAKRRIIIVKDSKGKYYAIGACNEEACRKLINLITRRAMTCNAPTIKENGTDNS